MNRKKNPGRVQFGPAVVVVVVCVVLCGLALGFVWQKTQIAQLGEQIKEREINLEELRRANKKIGDELAELKSPVMLDQMVRQWGLDLKRPEPRQIVVLQEQLKPKPVQSASR